jgi:hypothetical protein
MHTATISAGLLLALCLSAAPGYAQAAGAARVPGGRDVTCREFAKLGAAQANEVLYYADGYAAGIQDQIAAGTPNVSATTAAGTTATSVLNADTKAGSAKLSDLTSLTLDELKAVCAASPSATVLSMIPGGRPVSGSGTITASGAVDGSTAPAAGVNPAGSSSGIGANAMAAGTIPSAGSGILNANGTTGGAAIGATPGTTVTNPASGTISITGTPPALAAPTVVTPGAATTTAPAVAPATATAPGASASP